MKIMRVKRKFPVRTLPSFNTFQAHAESYADAILRGCDPHSTRSARSSKTRGVILLKLDS